MIKNYYNSRYKLLRKHDIHIKSKSYKLELLGELVINMVSELGLAGGPGFEPSLCNLIPICLFEIP